MAGFWIHLASTGLILIALALWWRRECLAGLLFLALCTAYVIMACGKFGWVTSMVAGPTFG